jgi:hypothetical protein
MTKKEVLDLIGLPEKVDEKLSNFPNVVTYRDKIVSDIVNERLRQLNLPGSEFDIKHTHNDWISIAVQYLGRASSRKHMPISTEEYRDALIKAGAVILAALEHKGQ